jgi:MATE family multidrug resistance protein
MPQFWAAEELRAVLTLAAPIAALQAGLLLYGTVSTILAGRLGAQAIATVGLGASTYFLLQLAAFGILLGIDPLSSRAYGAGRRRECADVLVHALALAVLAALPVFAALSCAGRIFAALRVEPGLAASTAAYLRILRWALFPGLIFAACRQYLQTLDITRPQLVAVIAGNIVNAVLGYALMFGRFGAPALGVRGAAFAALAAHVLMGTVGVVSAALPVARSGWRWQGLKPQLFGELFRLGGPAGMQMLAEGGAFSLATVLCGRLGPVSAAAHQIALNLAGLSFMVPLGISHAAAVRVGQSLGRGRPEAAARSGWAALGLSVAFMSLTSLAYVFLPRQILGLYTREPAVVGLGVRLLAVAAFFQVFDGTQVAMTGALRGLGETRLPMIVNLAGHWLVGLPVGLSLAFVVGQGVFGLWIGLCLGLCVVAVTLLEVWRRRTRRMRIAVSAPVAAEEAFNVSRSPGAI